MSVYKNFYTKTGFVVFFSSLLSFVSESALWELSVAMETIDLSLPALKPNAGHLPPQ